MLAEHACAARTNPSHCKSASGADRHSEECSRIDSDRGGMADYSVFSDFDGYYCTFVARVVDGSCVRDSGTSCA